MRKTLTHANVEALKPPSSGQIDYWDTRTPGFGVRVSMGGAKSWILMYRRGGRKRRLVLGRFPEMGLADARLSARGHLGDIARGADPAQERVAAKAAETFGELAELYLERHAFVHKRPRSAHEDVLMLNADLLPAWRNRKLLEIKRKDVIALLDEIMRRGAPIHANRVRGLISVMFNFAIGRDLIEYNPAHKVPRPAPERTRDRVLTDDELRRLWVALHQEPLHVAAFFKLALLLAARKSELLGMAWSEVDRSTGWWTIPAARAKNNLSHRVPLGPMALDLLRSLNAMHDEQWVFPGGRVGRSQAQTQGWVQRIRQNAGLEDFRLHDLRRTAASNLTSLGIPRLVVSKLLNHAEGGVTRIYDRHSYDAEKRAALLRWEERLSELVTGENIAPRSLPE